MTPRITVILVATYRTEYLRDALASVVNQDISPQYYEVILIKNFADDALDLELIELAKMRKFSIMTSSNERFGGKLVEALSHSTGGIICILDDDDLWEINKLSNVLELFEKNPELVYYHNDSTVIDAGGKVVRIPEIKGVRNRGVEAETDWISKMQIYLSMRADFNGSSISVRRKVISGSESFVSEMNSTVDTILFYLALEQGGSILADSRMLTRYRVGQTSLSLPGQLGLREYAENRCSYHTSQVRNFRQIRDTILTRSNNIGLVMSSIQELSHLILVTVYCRTGLRRRMMHYLKMWLSNAMKYRILHEPSVLILGASYLLSRRLSVALSYQLFLACRGQ